MISVFGSKIGKEEIQNVISCMKDQWLGFGKEVEKFEIEFSQKLNLKSQKEWFDYCKNQIITGVNIQWCKCATFHRIFLRAERTGKHFRK